MREPGQATTSILTSGKPSRVSYKFTLPKHSPSTTGQPPAILACLHYDCVLGGCVGNTTYSVFLACPWLSHSEAQGSGVTDPVHLVTSGVVLHPLAPDGQSWLLSPQAWIAL